VQLPFPERQCRRKKVFRNFDHWWFWWGFNRGMKDEVQMTDFNTLRWNAAAAAESHESQNHQHNFPGGEASNRLPGRHSADPETRGLGTRDPGGLCPPPHCSHHGIVFHHDNVHLNWPGVNVINFSCFVTYVRQNKLVCLPLACFWLSLIFLGNAR
jgi:hypothetical protein